MMVVSIYPGSPFAKTFLFKGDTAAPASDGLDARGRNDK